MNRVYAVVLACLAAFYSLSAQSLDGLQGKCGADLKAAIGQASRVKRPVVGPVGKGSMWAAFYSIDNDNGCVIDRFSGQNRYFGAEGVEVDDMKGCHIAPTEWWKDETIYGDTLSLDLHNLFPCESSVALAKNDYPMGDVVNALFDNGVTQSGIGYISGVDVNLWEPADKYKGDFARVLMYVVALYPTTRVAGLGINFMQNNNYPSLNNYAKRLLLAWHYADPVSGLERKRNDAVAQIQGNRNFFVDYPALADYVWGEFSDRPYDAEIVKVPLRSTYRLDDARIDLYHKLVPTDAKWTVDGTDIDVDYIIPAQLGVGEHELRFESGGKKGKLKIKIVE